MAEYCGQCAHLDLKNKESYTTRDRYYCDKCHRYQELTEKACYNFLRNPSQGKETGGYTPSGCYITTIVVNTLGYDDNCTLLNILRDFRDRVLKVSPEYISILMEYDIVGPMISERIQNHPCKMSLSMALMERYLIPCVDLIKNKMYKEAIATYTEMVEMLKTLFQLKDYQSPTKVDISSLDYETLGKGRIRTPKLVTD